ncbi:pentapeptide repeat-containing protein [Streptomyces sp. ISL-10]|nr:pentapeptide repeat-containing protein [Streptomyces sp. ISL-10]
MRRRRYTSDTTVAEWALIEPSLPVPACQTRKGGRPETHPQREIVDAIRYVVDTGCKWRSLPRDFPPWSTVYKFFARWAAAGVAVLRDQLRRKVRTTVGKTPQAVAVIIDSQSVKAAETVGRDSRGYDAAKKINGRKRRRSPDSADTALVRSSGAFTAWQRPGHAPIRCHCRMRITPRRGRHQRAARRREALRRRAGRLSGEGRRSDSGQGQRMALLVAALPGLTALVALLFTWVSVGQARSELRIAEHGQITNRFNAAVENLGSQSVDVRFGGIYALQRIMQDSSRDQPAIVSVLCAYVRQNARVPASGFDKINEDDLLDVRKAAPPTPITAVVTVLASRSPKHDGEARLDLSGAELRNLGLVGPFREASLGGADLRGAGLSGDLREGFFADANLSHAVIYDANLKGAYFGWATMESASLTGAKMARADFTEANLRNADLSGSHADANDLTRAVFFGTDMRGASLDGAKLTGAIFIEADLSGADLMGANLHGARLSAADRRLQDVLGAEFETDVHASLRNADLTEADLTDADLRGVDLSGADLTRADLRGAKLNGVKLTGATTTGVRGLPRSLLSQVKS